MTLFDHLPYTHRSIRLRKLCVSDFGVFHAYRSDPEVARFQGWWPMSEDAAMKFLCEHGARTGLKSGGWVQLAIADAASDRLLGDIGLWLSHDNSEAELGITVAPHEQGRGVGRDAMRAGLAVLFGLPTMTRVCANADALNMPCRRMLVAAGFREFGTAEVFVKEQACLEHQYAVTRDQWASAPEEQ